MLNFDYDFILFFFPPTIFFVLAWDFLAQKLGRQYLNMKLRYRQEALYRK
jgi:hypothetical protein